VSLSLVGGQRSDNLLYGGRNLHGLQPFHFSARDLLDGVGRSAYGQNRKLVLPNSAGILLVRIDRAVIDTQAKVAFVKALDVTVTIPARSRRGGCEFKLR
jgi:hypothetical protein